MSGWTPNDDGLPRRDRDVTDKRLRVGGRLCAKGIGTHAPSRIVYRLDARYEQFTAQVCGGEAGGTVVFRVIGDGKVLYESAAMRGLRGVARIDIPLNGVRTLELVVTDAGDNYYHDMANWGDVRVYAVEQEPQP